MNRYGDEEKRNDIEKWLRVERIELGKEIRRGNYERAAAIAHYISEVLIDHVSLAKVKSS